MSNQEGTLSKILRTLVEKENLGTLDGFRIMVDNKLLTHRDNNGAAYTVYFSRDFNNVIDFEIKVEVQTGLGKKFKNVSILGSCISKNVKGFSPYYQFFTINTLRQSYGSEWSNISPTLEDLAIQELWDRIEEVSINPDTACNHPLSYKIRIDRNLDTLFVTSPIFRQIAINKNELNAQNLNDNDLKLYLDFKQHTSEKTIRSIFFLNYIIQTLEVFPLFLTRKLHSSKRDPRTKFLHQNRNEVELYTQGKNFLHLFYRSKDIICPFYADSVFADSLQNSILGYERNVFIFHENIMKKNIPFINFDAITVYDFCKVLGLSHKLNFDSAVATTFVSGLLAPIFNLDITRFNDYQLIPLNGITMYYLKDANNDNNIFSYNVNGSIPLESAELWLNRYRKRLAPPELTNIDISMLKEMYNTATERVFS